MDKYLSGKRQYYKKAGAGAGAGAGGGGSAGAGGGGSAGAAGKAPSAPKRPEGCALADMSIDAVGALSPDQRVVLELVNARKHVFMTGCAGSGKTQTAIALREAMIAAGTTFELTASTAVSAQLLGGSTLHSLLWIWTNDTDESADWKRVQDLRLSGATQAAEAEEAAAASRAASHAIRRLSSRTKRAAQAKERLIALEVLVIDEVSMISAQVLYTAMFILKSIRSGVPRKAPMPVVVLVGDFTQLLPVCGDPALNSTAWKQLGPVPVVLTTSFRQKGDSTFLDVLNEVRLGKVSPESAALLRARELAALPSDVDPTVLLAYRADVDKANAQHLSTLPGAPVSFQAKMFIGSRARGEDWKPVGGSKAVISETVLLKNVRIEVPLTCTAKHVTEYILPAASTLAQTAFARSPAVLDLKVGAQVMFTAACDCSGVGGGGEEAMRTRVVNGTRGIVVDFAPWPVVRLLTGRVVLAAPLPKTAAVDGIEEILPGCLSAPGKASTCPLRQRERLMMEGPALVCCQVPLMLAKALTIHKAQGMTLTGPTRVSMNVFAQGQAYVALSRLTCWEDLFLCNFHTSKVTAEPTIVEWYERHMVKPAIGEMAVDTADGV